MAIVPMKRVAALVPVGALPGFNAWLYQQSLLHLTRVGEELPESYVPPLGEGEEAKEKVEKLSQTLALIESWGGRRNGFLEGVLSARPTATLEEMREAAVRMDVDSLHSRYSDLKALRDSLHLGLANAEKERHRLAPFAAVDVPLSFLGRLHRATVVLLKLPLKSREVLETSAPRSLAWERMSGELFWLAYPAGEEESASFLAALGGERVEAPSLEVSPGERLRTLEREMKDLVKQMEGTEGKCRACAAEVRDLTLALGYWEAEAHRGEDVSLLRASPRVGVAHGYLPAEKLPGFTEEVRSRFHGEVLAEDPKPGEAVPVALVSRFSFFEPVRILIRTFGVPDYFSVDPTPVITFLFLIFFGLCFSDVVYGFMLMGVAAWLRHKFRLNRGLRHFFNLLFQGGASTVVFGALLGSWAADLADYLGEGNILARMRNLVPHVDPMAHVIVGLMVVIGIGILTQYVGIGLLVWRNWRRGDRKGALFDGGLWFFYLTGILCLLPGVFAKLPPVLFQAGLGLVAVGAVGLILTQGRDQESWAGRLITGVVSLYGILGSYGATSFIGDTLSYSRLLALGLTTGIVGMSFNILAKIVGAVPYAGPVFFVGMVLFGHTFNFAMSIIGSFVHPMRLVLLEFFGRFYEAGGVEYRPFGSRSDRVEIVTE